MWINKIRRAGRARAVTIPAPVLDALGWKIGDFVAVTVVGDGTVTLNKVTERKLTDKIIEAATPDSQMQYE